MTILSGKQMDERNHPVKDNVFKKISLQVKNLTKIIK